MAVECDDNHYQEMLNDLENTMCMCVGQEAALDVQLEIRNNAAQGKPIKTYALYLPPYRGPDHHKTLAAIDFSICRGLLVRYAKIY